MANSPSAKKRIRQNDRSRLRNKSTKSEIKTLTKKLIGHIEAKEKDEAEKLYRTVIAKMDRAGLKRIYHPNTVARKKSKITRLLASLA